MRIATFPRPIAIAASLACAGCAGAGFWNRQDDALDSPPDAVVAENEATTLDAESPPEPPRPPAPAYINDGLRLPDNMLTLPSDRELRRPVAPESSGGVTARPPVEPSPGNDP